MAANTSDAAWARESLSSLREGVVVLSDSGEILFSNARAAETLGSSGCLLGRNVADVLVGIDRIASSVGSERLEVDVETRTGEVLAVGVSVARLRSDTPLDEPTNSRSRSATYVCTLRSLAHLRQLQVERDRLLQMGALNAALPSVLRSARRALRRELAEAEAQHRTFEAQIVDTQASSRHLSEELERTRRELASRVPSDGPGAERMEEVVSLLRRLSAGNQGLATSVQTRLEELEVSVQSRLGPDEELVNGIRAELAQLHRGAQKSVQLQADLGRKLQPLLQRDQEVTALGSLDRTLAEKGDLPKALTLIADAGGFGTVVLSDNVGLPLANNHGGKDIEVHAGLSSLLLTLVDRVKGNELPVPIAAVFRDQANQVVVHRVFSVGGERYVLTAVATGTPMAPDVLDPTLKTVERIIDRARW